MVYISVVFVLRNICHAPRSGDAVHLIMTDLKDGGLKKAGMGEVVDGEVKMPEGLRGEAVQANTKEVGDYILITKLRLMRGWPTQKVSVRAHMLTTSRLTYAYAHRIRVLVVMYCT
jgi:hypothetical protein